MGEASTPMSTRVLFIIAICVVALDSAWGIPDQGFDEVAAQEKPIPEDLFNQDKATGTARAGWWRHRHHPHSHNPHRHNPHHHDPVVEIASKQKERFTKKAEKARKKAKEEREKARKEAKKAKEGREKAASAREREKARKEAKKAKEEREKARKEAKK